MARRKMRAKAERRCAPCLTFQMAMLQKAISIAAMWCTKRGDGLCSPRCKSNHHNLTSECTWFEWYLKCKGSVILSAILGTFGGKFWWLVQQCLYNSVDSVKSL